VPDPAGITTSRPDPGRLRRAAAGRIGRLSPPSCRTARKGVHIQPDRQALADGLVRIGEDAVAKSNDRLLDAYFTDDHVLHSPAGELNRDEIKAYFAALRASFSGFTISRAQILVDGNYVAARTFMTGRFDSNFAYTPVGNVTATGKQARWELQNCICRSMRTKNGGWR
jgi:hypothetical protein